MFLTDEEMEEIESHSRPEATEIVHQPQSAMMQPIPLYPLALAHTPAPNGMGTVPNGAEQEAWALRRLAGVPVWAWGLLGIAGGAAGYFYWRGRQEPMPNKDDSSSDSSVAQMLMNAANGGGEEKGGWSPSRTRMAEQLERYLQKKGGGAGTKVWHDADEAREKGKLVQVSPLVNIQMTGKAFKVDAVFTRFCRREGLNPVQHKDGSIGLYPHSTKRGKEWEEYVDALRDEGQKV